LAERVGALLISRADIPNFTTVVAVTGSIDTLARRAPSTNSTNLTKGATIAVVGRNVNTHGLGAGIDAASIIATRVASLTAVFGVVLQIHTLTVFTPPTSLTYVAYATAVICVCTEVVALAVHAVAS